MTAPVPSRAVKTSKPATHPKKQDIAASNDGWDVDGADW